MKKFLIIQTAFIGDVILATPVIEKLHAHYPDAQIDFVLRKGNEGLLEGHPLLNQVFIWQKNDGKYKNLLKLARELRKTRYDSVINLQRFAASGWLTMRAKAKEKIGFDKNPFSFAYSKNLKHEIGNGKHEIERNLELVAHLTDDTVVNPKLYPSAADFEKVEALKQAKYYCLAPTSVWYTKQYPDEKWVNLVNALGESNKVYLLGAPGDQAACDSIQRRSFNKNVTNLCGKLSLLQSAALMENATMNYVNDSAPMHMASSMNAPVTAIFCSTIPAFGFGPLSDESHIVETKEELDCRPCGLHGFENCPKGHFKCAKTITLEQLLPASDSE